MKTNVFKIITGALIMIAIAGCTTGSATRTSSTTYQPTDSSSVEILFEKPDRPYTVIGHVRSDGSDIASDDAVYRAMQKEAAELGANAIIVNETVSGGFMEMRNKRAGALAIRWKSGESKKKYAVTPTSTKPTTPEAEQIIPKQ